MSNTLVIDIETLPCDDPAVIKRIAKKIAPPGNIKKKESIAKWFDENYENALKTAIEKTSLSGSYGRIACIAWELDGDVYSTQENFSEQECLNFFYGFILANKLKINSFCGHNIASFDLPFIKHRSIILGIKPPRLMIDVLNARYFDCSIKDTMHMYTCDRTQKISLDELMFILGIEHGHADFSGAMVADTWIDDQQKVIDYCISDVLATRAVYNRLTFNYDSNSNGDNNDY